MLSAIITKLKTGSITNIYPKGDLIIEPIPPYVYVWQGAPIAQPGNTHQGKNIYTVSVHFPQGYINDLDDYIFNELLTLLDRKILITRDLRKVECILDIEGISGLIEGNDDKTISKERQIQTAAMY